MLETSNQRIKRLRRLLTQRKARTAEAAFVIEGPQVVAEALADAGVAVESLYLDTDFDGGSGPDLEALAARRGITVHRTASGVLERVLDTVNPQPVAAVCHRREISLDELTGPGPVVLVVEGRDPGNIGTIIRSAEAAGAAGVILAGSSVDPTNPKALRASAGAALRLPVVTANGPLEQVLSAASLAHRELVAMVAAGADARSYHDVDLADAIIAVGNEAHGLPADLVARADTVATIELAGPTESLNLAIAASVVCFEALRQRRARNSVASTSRTRQV